MRSGFSFLRFLASSYLTGDEGEFSFLKFLASSYLTGDEGGVQFP